VEQQDSAFGQIGLKAFSPRLRVMASRGPSRPGRALAGR